MSRPAWIPAGEHFVVISATDLPPKPFEWDAYGIPYQPPHHWDYQGGGPIVGEVYLGDGTTIAAAKDRERVMGPRYGGACVARLDFGEVRTPRHTAGLLALWSDVRTSRLGNASEQAVRELAEALRADGLLPAGGGAS